MRPPAQWLAPGAGTAMPPPPPRRQEADRRNGGPAPPPKRPLHPGCRGTTAEEGARTPCPLPADGGPAAPRTAQTEQPCQRPAQGRRGRERGRWGSISLPPPPPRRTDPLAADQAAPDARGRPATPRARVYTGGARRRQRMAGRRPMGRGGGEAAPPPTPPAPPPLGNHRSHPPPPLEPRGRPPSPRRDRDAGGGGCGWTCKPRPSAPSRSCGGRGCRASPHQRAGATRGPSLGAAHGGAPEQYGGRAPHDPSMTTAHSGRAEGGLRSAGAPGGAVRGPPLTPPRPGAAL